jgi:phage terminase large subunit-like protein
VEGESGILKILEEYGSLETWNRSLGELILTNGSRIKLFSSEEPNRLRGPQHHGAWIDELAAFENADTFDQLQFGLRLGQHPKTIITTTPRPTKLIKELLTRESVVVTRGSTFENSANLSPSALLELQARYSGTRLGEQELYGKILETNENALWNHALIDNARMKKSEAPSFYRVVVGIDPAVTSTENSDSTGIIVAAASSDGHFYILEDCTMKGTPQEWATRAALAYDKHSADKIIAETNNGGDLVLHLLHSVRPNIPVKKVTATRGKAVRAEPISALYEQGRVHHLGYFDELETQMCEWEPNTSAKSPDRMDALVWALTELSEGSGTLAGLAALGKLCSNCSFPNLKSAGICINCQTLL